jgi:hypothetical protein
MALQTGSSGAWRHVQPTPGRAQAVPPGVADFPASAKRHGDDPTSALKSLRKSRACGFSGDRHRNRRAAVLDCGRVCTVIASEMLSTALRPECWTIGPSGGGYEGVTDSLETAMVDAGP